MSEEAKRILRKVNHQPGDGHADYLFWCPGCKCCHGVWTSNPNGLTGATWNFNNNLDKPTFQPSILTRHEQWEPPVTPENLDQWKQKPWPQHKVSHVCHLFVTNGMIQFLGDCTHEYKGRTIPMEGF